MAQPALTTPIVAVIAAKGGVGKTTVAANLCIALAESGRKVLAIDLDPQNALRFHLVIDRHACEVGLAQTLIERRAWSQAMQVGRNGVVVLPFGSIDDEAQIGIEHFLAGEAQWLSRTIAQFQLPPGTVVVLDTPPGPSVYLQQALRASTFNVVTLLPDAGSFATRAITEKMVDKYCRPRADFVANGYIVNQVDTGKRLSRDVLQALRAELGTQMLGVIHQDQAVSEALASAAPIRSYAPYCQAAQDFSDCAGQLLRRLDSPTFP